MEKYFSVPEGVLIFTVLEHHTVTGSSCFFHYLEKLRSLHERFPPDSDNNMQRVKKHTGRDKQDAVKGVKAQFRSAYIQNVRCNLL